MSNINSVKVSVCVVTYNQVNFVRQCLQSLVDQVTNFHFEVIVADDCSSDGTPAIIAEFVERYPGTVKQLPRECNLGPYRNLISVHEAANGQYIAHMDGDDYALPGKLQAQADYLDAHQDCDVVFHRMMIMNDAKNVIVEDGIDLSRFPTNRFGRADFLRLVTIGMHSSKMYRAVVRDFPPADFPAFDYFINVEQVGARTAAFVGERPLGVYRYGIGIASAGNGTNILLQKSMLYFARKYPANRKHIATAALVVFMAALKNRRWGVCRLFLPVIMRTFRPSSLKLLWQGRRVVPMLIIPRGAR